MGRSILSVFLMISLIVGIVELSPVLFALGLIGIGSYLIKSFTKDKSNKRKAKEDEQLTLLLNQYLQQYPKLQISSHVCITRKNILGSYLEGLVYFDDEYVGTVQDFYKEKGYEKVFDDMARKIKNSNILSGVVDMNHNGIDDRIEAMQEKEATTLSTPAMSNAEKFSNQIEEHMHYFTNPTVVAGLKEICDLLGKVKTLEEKYPDVSHQLKKLYDQYLPLLVGILSQYKELREKQASQSEMITIETKLEKTVVLVSEAIRTLMANFTTSDIINVSSDMTVLESILKRDGLVQEGTLGGMKNAN